MENVIAQEKLAQANEALRDKNEECERIKAAYSDLAAKYNELVELYNGLVTPNVTFAANADEPMVAPAPVSRRNRAATTANLTVEPAVAPVMPEPVEFDPMKTLYPETSSQPTE
jgi:hypothetical protein